MGSNEVVSVVGLGRMGLHMAVRVALRFDLLAYNRSAPALSSFQAALQEERSNEQAKEELDKTHVDTTSSLQQVGEKASVVLVMVDKDASFEEAILSEQGLLKHLRDGTVLVINSFLSKEMVLKAKAVVEQSGKKVSVVNCNVFGRPPAAKAGALISCPAGPEDTVERIKPILKSFSREIIYLGPELEKGTVFKLLGNFTVAVTVEMFSEVFAFAEKADMDKSKLLELFNILFPGFGVGYANRIAAQQYTQPGASVTIGLKDTALMQSVAAEVGAEKAVPLLDVCRQSLLAAKEKGWEDHDWVVVSAVLRQLAGLTPSI